MGNVFFQNITWQWLPGENAHDALLFCFFIRDDICVTYKSRFNTGIYLSFVVKGWILITLRYRMFLKI